MTEQSFDIAVIGAGPAGLAAACAACKEGKNVVLIEREAKAGGILKQCIHDGFGLLRFKQKLVGPEYADRYIKMLADTDVVLALSTFVSNISLRGKDYIISATRSDGMHNFIVHSIILATGCRERTARQISVHGSRPAGIFTAGSAQYYTNILGKLPTRRCVVLGSGDIGLIMARRLTLEGATVLGVYEAKSQPSGLSRNIYQCLDDFNIPLYTSHTVTRVFGHERVEAVEIASVDDNMQPIDGTQERVECDALILSVGLIPENELAQSLDIPLDIHTKGPIIDQNGMTMRENVYVCGNALHVNDLVDYVSENAETVGKSASLVNDGKRTLASITYDTGFLSVVPQKLELNTLQKSTVMYFRSRIERGKTRFTLTIDGKEIFAKDYDALRPPEMERVEIDFAKENINESSDIKCCLEVV